MQGEFSGKLFTRYSQSIPCPAHRLPCPSFALPIVCPAHRLPCPSFALAIVCPAHRLPCPSFALPCPARVFASLSGSGVICFPFGKRSYLLPFVCDAPGMRRPWYAISCSLSHLFATRQRIGKKNSPPLGGENEHATR